MLNKRLLPILFSLLLSLSFVSGCSRNEVIENPISVETGNVIATDTPQEKEIIKNDTTIKEDSSVEVHFIDVGQADAALLISDNEVMLIDGGNAPDSNLIYSYLTKHNISHIDYMIGTHAHEDHMGGLSGALSKATVGTVFAPKTENDAKFYQSFKRLVSEKGLSITTPRRHSN
ncbi:MAG: MBL fold metallo-hydrolase [Clostridia bacterium]|nr:MBL fold metallo-hydrolase [Clostridia bacterium]